MTGPALLNWQQCHILSAVSKDMRPKLLWRPVLQKQIFRIQLRTVRIGKLLFCRVVTMKSANFIVQTKALSTWNLFQRMKKIPNQEEIVLGTVLKEKVKYQG